MVHEYIKHGKVYTMFVNLATNISRFYFTIWYTLPLLIESSISVDTLNVWNVHYIFKGQHYTIISFLSVQQSKLSLVLWMTRCTVAEGTTQQFVKTVKMLNYSLYSMLSINE